MTHSSSHAGAGNSRLDSTQRRAIAQLVEERMDTRIDIARDRERDLENKIVAELARRFKVDDIKANIERLERQIKNLKARREELGFEERYDGSFVITGGRAKPLLETKVGTRSLAVSSAKDRKRALVAQVWLAKSAEEAASVLSAIDAEEVA